MVLNFSNFCKLNMICEKFQSGKLRNIIRQHGKPKYSFENEVLYDLKDNEVLGVAKDWKDYYDNFQEKSEEETFCIELEDGYRLVIGNLGLLKSYFSDNYQKVGDIFKRRIEKRHIGNQGRGGDTINREHQTKRYNILHKRDVEKIKGLMTDEDKEKITDIINSHLNFDDYDSDRSGETDYEDETTLFGYDAFVTTTYYESYGDEWESYGATRCNASKELIGVTIYLSDEEGDMDDEFTADELELNLKGFDTEEEIETGITDYYDYYGVSRSDFL